MFWYVTIILRYLSHTNRLCVVEVEVSDKGRFRSLVKMLWEEFSHEAFHIVSKLVMLCCSTLGSTENVARTKKVVDVNSFVMLSG